MPRGNGSGPEGRGPRTGRAAGYCAGYDRPGYLNQAVGRGAGAGRGGGRGRRIGFMATGIPGAVRYGFNPVMPTREPDQEFTRQALRNRAEALGAELDQIRQRLDELENRSEE